jgi:dTDP-glucose 4,6-dehydratase
MRILVTGGAGFIGSNFVLKEVAADSSLELLVNFDKLTYAGNAENLVPAYNDARHVFVRGDIGDEDRVLQILSENAIDAVINFAAESHVDRSIDGPEAFVQTNVLGTTRLLQSARRYWSGLLSKRKEAFRFLHVSTDEVYGSLGPDDPAFSEKTPFAPNSPYAASKAASDHLVRAFHHTYGLPVVTTNCSNNYGPLQFPEKLIPLMIQRTLSEQPLPIYGDGQNIRDWLYVSDHCTAIRMVLERGRLGETYNIGGLNERTNLEVVDTICTLLDEFQPRSDGKSFLSQKTFVSDRPGHDRRYAIDCAKITGELGWAPTESFETGLRKTVRWYLENQEWVANVTSGKYRQERLGITALEA